MKNQDQTIELTFIKGGKITVFKDCLSAISEFTDDRGKEGSVVYTENNRFYVSNTYESLRKDLKLI